MGDKANKAIRRNFIQIVADAMTVKDISLRGLASKTGMNPSYLSRILRGTQAPPSEEKIKEIAKALEIKPVERLLFAAGRFPDSRPKAVGLFRAAGSLTDKELDEITKSIEDMVKKRRAGRK